MSDIWSKMSSGLHVGYPLVLSDFNENLTLSAIFENYSTIKFHENPSSGSRVVARRQTDGHDEANSRFSQFCETA